MPGALAQEMAVAGGEVRRWTVDLGAMAARAGWASRDPDRLELEVTEILADFPTFLAAAGARMDPAECWVEAARPVLCARCDELVVFAEGQARCAACGRAARLPPAGAVGLVGRIPALISGRPFAASLAERITRLEQTDPQRAARWRQAVITVRGRTYLAPRYALWFPRGWPHADPPVMVWREYFDMLDIPPDHIYYAGDLFRLCLYATWREQPAVRVLKGRVVPRLLIDLMLADLRAAGRLDDALRRLGVTLYELYNLIGRHHAAGEDPFHRVYRELLGA